MSGIEIHTERIDDVPLLVEQQRRMGIAEAVDEAVRPHGNRKGLSAGDLTSFWLAYILSQADHRMSRVEPWAARLQQTLSALASEPLRVKDFTDDRLADVLRLLGDDETWSAIEERLGQRLVRVYDLGTGPVRLDSTSVVVYHDPAGSLLFQRGLSKDHRPDLPQFKVMLATLDPLGMPVATFPVAGNEPDDRLYLPAIEATRRVVGKGSRLYIGDTKMGSMATRASLQASGDYYLLPLAQSREVPALTAELLGPVWNKHQPLERVRSEGGGQGARDGPGELLALTYEASRLQTGMVDGQAVSWQERLLVVYSLSLVRQQRRNLSDRLSRCMRQLANLTPPRARGQWQRYDLDGLQSAVSSLLKKHQVEGLLEVSYDQEPVERRVYRGGVRPAPRQQAVRYLVQVRRDESAIAAARRSLGWRLYVSNAPSRKLGLAAAVRAYRGAPAMERNFHRLKGQALGIRPLYLQREDHTRGLIRLLSLALRVLTVVEHVVRQVLQASSRTLGGLDAANPKRETVHPTTERLLTSFRGITLTVVRLEGQTIRHLTPLSDLQQTILELLGLPDSVYQVPVDAAGALPP